MMRHLPIGRGHAVVTLIALPIFLVLSLRGLAAESQTAPVKADNFVTDAAPLPSGLNRSYDETFVLQPDDVRTIAAILREFGERLSSSATVRVRVSRADDRFYYTSDIERLFQDPNVPPAEIESVGIELLLPDVQRDPLEPEYLAAVGFPAGRRVRFVVYGSDPEWTLLLANEIEPHIRATFRLESVPHWLIATLLLLLLLFLTRFFINQKLRSSGSTKELADAASAVTVIGIVLVAADLLAGQFFDFMLVGWIRHFLTPRDFFAWGAGWDAFETARRTKDFVLWGVIAAFAVAIVANVAFHLAISRRRGQPGHGGSPMVAPDGEPATAEEEGGSES